MKLKLLYICLILLSATSLYPQFLQREYEYWGDDYFENPNRDSIDKDIFVSKISAGFFPKVATPMLFYFINESNGWDYSKGSFFINDIFADNTNPFFAQPQNDKILDNMKQKKPFSNDKKYGWFTNDKSRNNFGIGIKFDYPLHKIHTTISADVGIKTRYITAYTPVSIGEFVGYKGEKKKIEQLSFAEINDQHIYCDLNLKHPIYGFSKYNVSNNKIIPDLELYYYVIYGAGLNYSYFDKINVYEYILSNQNIIRFTNGEIRSPSVFKQDFDRVHSLRYHYNIGIGWHFGTSNVAGNFELIYRQSANSIIEDSDYKHNILLIRTGIDVVSVKNVALFYLRLFGIL